MDDINSKATNVRAYYSVPTWRSRALRRASPRPFIYGDKRTFITTNVHVCIGWLDRLRMLVSGRALTQVVTYTDVEVKDAQSVSVFSVE